MIRVTCPSCQLPHEFLEFYRGLTIYCKKCKAGILVPKDAESAPEPAAPSAPPVETSRAPIADANHDHAPQPVAETPAAEPFNHQFNSAVEPLPPEPLPPEPMPATPPARPRKLDFEDDEKPSNKRVLILAGILLVILLAGAAQIVRSFMKGGGTSIVAVDPSKKDTTNPEPKPEPHEKKIPEPKPVDGPTVDKEKTKEPTTKTPEVSIVAWYTTDELPYIPPSTMRYNIDEDELMAALVFLVVKVRLPGKLLGAVKADDKWTFELDKEHFLIQDDNENEGTAAGLELNGGFMELVGKLPMPKSKLAVQSDTNPSHHDASVVFTKIPFKTANELRLQLRYRNQPAQKLDASTRIKAPEQPKTIEKRIESAPKKEELKKIEIAKKPDETTKKVEVPAPSEKKTPNLTVDPIIEIIEWVATDTLPGADPEKKLMALSSSDRLDDKLFVSVKVKLLSKAFTAVKGEVRWTVRLNAKDFAIEGDAPQPFFGRGFEYDGNFGSTIATGYLPWAERSIPFEEVPDSLIQSVFFTVPRKVIEGGRLVLFYRDSAPVKMEESKRRK